MFVYVYACRDVTIYVHKLIREKIASMCVYVYVCVCKFDSPAYTKSVRMHKIHVTDISHTWIKYIPL
jgi:hypothetical protein